jgi:type I restriction enzyme S subunit
MTLDTFFEKFDIFADAPNAVGKMRELVLELAMQGKLVPPSTKPEKHPSWIAFQEERRNSTIGNDSEPQPVFEIPTHWEWCILDEVAKPCGQKIPTEKFTYIDVGSIDNARGELKPELNVIEAADAPSRARKLAQPGSIIYATVRPYLKNIAVIDRNFSPPAIISTAFAILNPLPFIESRFLFYWLRSSSFEREVNTYSKGVAYPAISDGDLKRCPIPVPPPSEQKRIVAKVDELMGLCDRLEAQQKEREEKHAALSRASLARFAVAPTATNLELLFHPSYSIPPADLRKSILTLAVQGKIVPQDPNDEPTEEIVSRVEAERPEETEAPVGEAELPWSLPSCWQWVRLGTIANIKHGYAFSSESFTSEPTRYVLTTPGNFYESGGFRDRGANTKYFNGGVPPAFVFNPRDLIIPMTEQAAGLLGSPAFIPDDGKAYLHNQRLGKLEFYSDEVAPEYVFWFFNSEFFRSELARTCTGMKVRHTSPKRILKVPFALPPLAEQRRIVAKVEQLMTLVDELEAQLTVSRATATKLLSALVAELTNPKESHAAVAV